MGQKQPELEELFEALDHVVKELENEEVSLEDAFSQYHEGMKLLKLCNEKIDHIEKQMQVLDENGESHEF